MWNTQRIPDGWIWQDIGNYYGAGASALNWRENQYDLILKSGKNIGERVKIDAFYEIFNAFNRKNPAAINGQPAPNLFGVVQQVLPGREGQVGFRIEF